MLLRRITDMFQTSGDRWWLSILLVGLTATSVASCGSERTYSGIWRQVGCEDSSEVECRDESYELHLGRYGENLTGLVVRYRTKDGLDSFQRSFACGCFFVEGGLALDDTISFGLYEPDAECSPIPNGVGRGRCTTCECPERRFQLKEIDGALVGTVSCGDGVRESIRFEPSQGRTRRGCDGLLDDDS